MSSPESLHQRLHSLEEQKATAERTSDPDWAHELQIEIAALQRQIEVAEAASAIPEETNTVVAEPPEAIPPALRTITPEEIIARERKKIKEILGENSHYKQK